MMSSVIKLSNFALYSSIGFLLPYLDLHFDVLAGPKTGGFESLRCVSSLLAIPASLALCSSADRNWTHRRVYLQCLACFLVAVTLLLALTIFNQSKEIAAPKEGQLSTEQAESEFLGQNLLLTLTVVCLIVSLAASTQMLEFLTINWSRKQELGYGSIRLFGSLGGLAASLVVGLFTGPQYNLQGLGVAPSFWMISLVMVIFNGAPALILVCLWPEEQPFDLEGCLDEQQTGDDGTKFHFAHGCWPSTRTENEPRLESQLVAILRQPKQRQPIRLLKANINYQFDERLKDAYRNIRRCSLAPLGDSFLVKQFELDHKNVRHFNFVTSVQPLASASMDNRTFVPTIEYSLNSPNGFTEKNQLDLARFSPAAATAVTSTATAPADLPIQVQFRLLKDLAERNNLFLRFLCSLAVIGMIRASTNTCLRCRVTSPTEQERVGQPLGYLCEIAFYLRGTRLVQLVSYEWSLILIVTIYASINGTQMIVDQLFEVQASAGLTFVAVATIGGSVCGAWLNCLLAESSAEFASESQFMVAKLCKSRPGMDSTTGVEQYKDLVRSGLRATVVCLLFSSLDQFGDTFGSMLGWGLCATYGLATVNLLNAGLALTFILIALMLLRCR